jgi:hypothetical protein
MPQLSEAVGGVQLTTALHEEVADDTIMFEGQLLICGIMLSITSTVKLQVEVLL